MIHAQFYIDPDALAKLVNKTKFAMSNEETRYYLNGVHLHTIERKLRAVATDGWQFSRVDVPLPAGAETMPPVIIPRKAVEEVSEMLKEGSGPNRAGIKMVTDGYGTRIEFHIRWWITASDLINADYPAYERIIPTDNPFFIVIDKRKFKQALRRVAAAAPKLKKYKTMVKPINLKFEREKLTMSAKDCSMTVDCKYKGDPFDLLVNARYLQNVVNQIDCSQIYFELKDDKTPIVIKDTTDPSVLFLIMPERRG